MFIAPFLSRGDQTTWPSHWAFVEVQRRENTQQERFPLQQQRPPQTPKSKGWVLCPSWPRQQRRSAFWKRSITSLWGKHRQSDCCVFARHVRQSNDSFLVLRETTWFGPSHRGFESASFLVQSPHPNTEDVGWRWSTHPGGAGLMAKTNKRCENYLCSH